MAKLAISGGKPTLDGSAGWVRWPLPSREDETNLIKVLRGQKWCRIHEGSMAERFEKEWAKYCGSKHCILTANGTVSLQLALRTLGVKPGDEVIVPAVTFIASASAITEVGAIPVFADIDPETGQLQAASVEEHIGKRTRGILGVHYAGYPFNLDVILRICRRKELFLVEDCAHAHGSEWKGRPVGSFGEFGSFSFQESKSLSSGEGGAVITSRENLYREALLIHNIGRVLGEPGYIHYILSSNYRICDLQAAVLLSQFKRLPGRTRTKQANAVFLKENLKDIGLSPLREDARITRRGYYYVVFRYDPKNFGGVPRDLWLKALQAEGIPAGPAFGVPLYRNPCFEKAALAKVYGRETLRNLPDYGRIRLPGAEKFCAEQVVFPQWVLLNRREKLQKIPDAFEKIKENTRELKGLK